MTRCSAKRIAHRGADVQPDDHLCDSYRQFNCGHCGRGIHICRCCDSGQAYCPEGECADLARGTKNQQYGADHQKTKKGRRSHARAQANYRLRRELDLIVGTQQVMDHPSTDPPFSATLSDVEIEKDDDATSPNQPVPAEFANREEDDDATAPNQPVAAELADREEDNATTPNRTVDTELVRCDVCGRQCRPVVHRWSTC